MYKTDPGACKEIGKYLFILLSMFYKCLFYKYIRQKTIKNTLVTGMVSVCLSYSRTVDTVEIE